MKREPLPQGPHGVVRFYNFLPEGNHFLDDVLTGFSQPHKRLPPAYLFDPRGTPFYAALCAQPECYLMQAEVAILREHLAVIANFIGPETELIELRSGVGVQAALLLEQLKPLVYVPIDLDGPMLQAASRDLAELFPWLNISGMCADLRHRLALPEFVGLPIRKKAVLFAGSVLGGFAPQEALTVLCNARQLVGTGGMLLAGIDLKKDMKTIVSAYSDASGMNAAFHLNLLERINRDLGADFQQGRFAYRASFNDGRGCMEMRLESLYAQFARVGGRRIDFAPNETVETGIAYQYSIAEFQALARKAGFAAQETWMDAAQMFSIHGMIAV